MEDTAVVTPVWLPHLPAHEREFLRISERNIGDSPRFLLAPESLDTTYYESQFPNWQVLRFPNEHFSNTRTYSHWLTTPDFYKSWGSFEFVLINQTDALIVQFPDSSDFHNVDYVGAPWDPPIRAITIGHRFSLASHDGFWQGPRLTRHLGRSIPVGNGGLSIRRVEELTRITEYLQEQPFRKLTSKFQEDALLCCLGPRWGLRIAPLPLARATFMEKEATRHTDIPPVCGFHALWKWNRRLAEKVIGDYAPEQT